MFTIRKGFCLPESHVGTWTRAAVNDLERRGHRFPNLDPRGAAALGRMRGLHWEELPPVARPDFAVTLANWDWFRSGGDDLRFVIFYFDLPETCHFWAGDDAYNRTLCRVHMRQHDRLCTLLPNARVCGTWLDFAEDATREPLYATEATLRILAARRR